MKAMTISGLGGPDVFTQTERQKPEIKAGHILIEVKATSVNPLDTMLRSVETPWSANLPEILHGDVAGIVAAVGTGVTRFKVGDEVYGCAGGIAGIDGALAEFMLADAHLIAHKPKRLSMREAAALPLVSITAWEALVNKLKIGENHSVLIHGGSGGVGHIAVQLAKYLGATVYSTASTQNLDTVKQLGADHVIDYKQESVANYVKKYTDDMGFDAVFDTVAGKNIDNSFNAVRYNGAVATVLPIENPLPIALKGLSFHSVLQPIPLFHGIGRKRHGEILEKIATLVDTGYISPLIDASDFSIWQVAKAHERLTSRQATGKIVLTV
ncbi:zinc-dependent alcohol dehydrogenase family protein [Endozoicomonas sp. Mp262]|uniref:zinc-dependent alcohol dehydrogenase family protein n=1 Tax=Endozoicomonas sp. Mp262 TaxID=2919499 RepID=UPI0021DAEB06